MEIYAEKPERVEVYPLPDGQSDVIMRDKIEQVEGIPTQEGEEPPKVWRCEEVQGRVPGPVDREKVKKDWKTWWQRLAFPPEKEPDPTMEERVEVLEGAVLEIIMSGNK